MQFFKSEDNLEVAISFICDPCQYNPNDLWYNYYPELLEHTPNLNLKYFKLDVSVPAI